MKRQPQPPPTGYFEGQTYYRPVQTVLGTWVHLPVCHICGSQHSYKNDTNCIQALAHRIGNLERGVS